MCISIPFSETRVCMHTSHDMTSIGCKKQPLKPETTRAIMTATHRRMRQRYVLVLVPVSLFLSPSLCPCSCRCPCPCPCLSVPVSVPLSLSPSLSLLCMRCLTDCDHVITFIYLFSECLYGHSSLWAQMEILFNFKYREWPLRYTLADMQMALSNGGRLSTNSSWFTFPMMLPTS